MDIPWSTTTRIIVIVLLVLALIWLFVIASPLFQALTISALLAYMLDPAVEWIRGHLHVSRAGAARLVVILFLLFLIGILASLGTVVVSQFQDLKAFLVPIANEIRAWLARPIVILGLRFQPQALLDSALAATGNALGLLPGGSLNILSSITTNLLWTMAVLGTLYWFLRDAPRIKPWLLSLVPAEQKPEIARLIDEVDFVWARFLRVQVFMFFLLGALMVIGALIILALFRVGLLPWSVLTFILMLILVYTLVQQLDNLWLRPQFMGRELRLHPGVVFVGLIGALALSGILGTIVVVPTIASARVIGRYIHRKLLGLPPWPTE